MSQKAGGTGQKETPSNLTGRVRTCPSELSPCPTPLHKCCDAVSAIACWALGLSPELDCLGYLLRYQSCPGVSSLVTSAAPAGATRSRANEGPDRGGSYIETRLLIATDRPGNGEGAGPTLRRISGALMTPDADSRGSDVLQADGPATAAAGRACRPQPSADYAR